ncbi:helix-turn-helix transcriptional regulator [Bacillus xiapuensis]|uniref:helix-turn-helix transcriptional regulator n=1 Tax=Bacillus xiapuensis TaxID=2014075 RepID=UPI000C2432C1|nr:L-2-amino-thiazoline-4-carboxylic acid hydrolase [Bacillus xiapuensis]
MEQTLKLTATLADSTRFSIYQYMVQHQKEFSVQDIATQFHIHPNVARLHLSKLEDIQVIKSHLNKSGKGGRPGKLYRTADKAIQLSFPHRDYQLLANISLAALSSLGQEGVKAAEKAGRAFGLKNIQQRTDAQRMLTRDEKLQHLQELSFMTGSVPVVEETGDHIQVHFSLHNCPFKESLEDHGELICRIHMAFLEGALTGLFNSVSFEMEENLAQGCKECKYHAVIEYD